MSNIIQIKHGASDPTPQILQPYELGYKEKEGLYINDGGVVRPVGGQSDYQQNDSAAADFIKNRTHYIATETEELVNGKLFFTNSGDDRVKNFILRTGSKYKVFFDGGEYECVAFDIISEGEVFQAIGNIFLMNGESSLTNEPFLFLYKGKGWHSNFEYYLSSFNVEHIVSIYSIEDNNATLLQDKILFLDPAGHINKITKANFSTEVEVKEEKYWIYFNGEEFILSPANNSEIEIPAPYFFIGSEDKDQFLENGVPFGVYGLLGFNEAFLQIAAWNIFQPDWYNIEIHRTYSFIEPINPYYLPEEGVGYSKIESTSENFDLVEVIDKLIENSSEYDYFIGNNEPSGKKYIKGFFCVTDLPFEILPNEKYEILLNGKEYKTKSTIIYEEFYTFGDVICDFLGLYDDIHIVVGYEKVDGYQFIFYLTIDMEYFGLEDFPKEILIKKIAQEEEIHQINEKYIPHIQQDWNENNPESKSYIANRTHWIEKHRTIVLDWLTRNSWSGDEVIYWNNYPIIPYLEEGKEYIVAVSSEYESENVREYRCKCQKYNEERLLLGEDLYENYPNNQYPFGIYIDSDGECSITTTENIRWISISYETETVHKIDKKFLPEGTGGSGVSSWNDLTDKPFYEEWGHVTINKPEIIESFSIMEGETPVTFCKISNLKPTKEELVGCLFTSEDGETVEITEDYFAPEDQFIGMISFEPGMFVVYNQRVIINPSSSSEHTVTFPSTGIWIVGQGYDNFSSLEYDGWNVHPLDEKFIPDSIARKSNIKDVGWNNLVDKPFGKPLSYSWDVNTTPLEVAYWQGQEIHKINGYSPTVGDFAGGKVQITYVDSSGTQKEELFLPEMDSPEWEEGIAAAQNTLWGKGWWSLGEVLVVVTEEEAIINADLILSKGLWVCPQDSLTEFTITGKYGHIYEDFIPDTIARLEDVTLKPAQSFGYYEGLTYLEKIEMEDWQSGDTIVFYKISDEAIPYYNFLGGTLETVIKGEITGETESEPVGTKVEYNISAKITEDSIRFTEGGYSIEGLVLIVTDKSISLEGEEFSRGIWVQDGSYYAGDISGDGAAFQLEYYARFEQEVIDEQIIPKTIARTSELVKSWSDLKDIPFGKKKYEFIIGTQYETVTNGTSTFSKITNHIPNLEELYHGFFGMSVKEVNVGSGSEGVVLSVEIPIVPELVYQYDGYFTAGLNSGDVTTGGVFVVVTDDSVKIEDIKLTHGTWFAIGEDLEKWAEGSIYLTKPLYFETIDEEYLPSTTPKVEKASVGQVVVIKSVDKNGKPTAWEAIDPWVVQSSTAGSNKKFRLSVDDSGVITATEIT